MIGFRCVLVLALALVAGTASAQSTSDAAVPPDVVTTKDGGMYRGTILAKVPGEYVEITLPNGETKKLDMAGVEYAGPSEGMNAQKSAATKDTAEVPHREANADESRSKARPTVVVVADEASLELTSSAEPLTFHRRAASATATSGKGVGARATGYEEMCTTPCTVKMPSGTHTLALGPVGDDAHVVEAPAVTVRAGESTLTGTFEDNSTSRTVGAVFVYGGLIGGILVELAMLSADADTTTSVFTAIGIMAGGVTVGLIVATPDKAQVDVASMPRDRAAPGVEYSMVF